MKNVSDKGGVMEWRILCKRTEDPKLAWIELALTDLGIKHRRNGRSFHAPILEVEAERAKEALGFLDTSARVLGLHVKYGTTLDEVPDDHPCFGHPQPNDYVEEDDDDEEDPNDYVGMGWVGSDGKP